MARVPCSFSAQRTFIDEVDARAEQLGMKRSEYIVHALRKELQNSGESFSIAATQVQVGGKGNRQSLKKRAKK